MKHKFIVILVSIIFSVPTFCFAMPLPIAHLTVVVNNQGGDDSFNFDLNEYDGGGPVPIYTNQFAVQTQNLSGTITVLTDAYGNNVILSEQEKAGFKVGGILCISSNLNDVFFYNKNSVTFIPHAYSNITCTFSNIQVQEKIPVLIVPGLLGTEMMKEQELLWADMNRMVTNPSDTFMDPLAFNQDLIPSDQSVYVSSVISRKVYSSIELFDYTYSLRNEFVGQGYVEGETLFTFPYDWRYGVSGKYLDGKTNSDLLKEKIDEILQQTGADKVDVVAHSMGGLIVKKYVVDNLASSHIGKAVFVGVPNTGAPDAVKALIQGDNFGVSFGPFGLNDLEMKKLSANMPGVYDLLPSLKYYFVAGSFVSEVDFGNGLSDPIINDLDYSEFENYLVQDNNLNSLALLEAKNLHAGTFDSFDLRTAGVDLYTIDGCKTATTAKFYEVKSKDILGIEHTEYQKIDFKAGDGTVPIQSSTNLPIDQSKKYYALTGVHSKLMSQDGSRQEIVNLISGSGLAVSGNLITQDVSQCQLDGKVITVYSPVDITVIDQNGNKLGLADGNIINNIPGANYKILGEHKFIFLPESEGQNYTVNMQGTGNGTFTIKVENIVGEQTTKTEEFKNIPVTTQLTGTVDLSDSLTTLLVKETPTSPVKTILPTPDLPTIKKQCKNNGWKNFGNKFKNQGDCVSFVEKKK